MTTIQGVNNEKPMFNLSLTHFLIGFRVHNPTHHKIVFLIGRRCSFISSWEKPIKYVRNQLPFLHAGILQQPKIGNEYFFSSWIINVEECLRLKSTRTQQWSYSFQWTEKAICFLSPVIIMEKRKRKKTQNKISEHY